jgi:2-oxoglutarate/2-oxoacid ferredoxin oxidoreductase subunit beta
MTIDLPLPGLRDVPRSDVPSTRKDYASDQEVRWCPGCGDYVVLAAVQAFLPSLGVKRENLVFVSGIGCSSRFPYYLQTYGVHSIHGRAPAIATGLATTRPDLSVWVVTGDGDALSIGGNHLIHALRRNVNLTILLFNNRIYGLTKGQYSPTSEPGKITKSTPAGSVDRPFNPVSLALGAEATFVARTLDSDRAHLTAVLQAAAAHRGASLVEIYQNCPIFNDGAFDVIKDPAQAEARLVRLEHGKPVRVGDREWIHDVTADNPAQAFELSRLDDGTMTSVPIGIFRQVERPTYDGGRNSRRRGPCCPCRR